MIIIMNTLAYSILSSGIPETDDINFFNSHLAIIKYILLTCAVIFSLKHT